MSQLLWKHCFYVTIDACRGRQHHHPAAALQTQQCKTFLADAEHFYSELLAELASRYPNLQLGVGDGGLALAGDGSSWVRGAHWPTVPWRWHAGSPAAVTRTDRLAPHLGHRSDGSW